MGLKVWMDGELVDHANAKIGVYDHGLLYGDGVFEGIRLYHGKIFAVEGHLERFFLSAKAIRLTIPYSPQQLREAMELTCRTNNFTDCYIRLVATRGQGNLGLNPLSCPKPAVFIIADLISLYPAEMYEKGMSVITARTIRNHPAALSPRIKSLNYLNNILAKIEANDAGVPEAIMLNHQGNVAECTADNIFIVRHQQVQTPATADGILEGVTRQTILDLCKELQIPLVEKTLQLHDLYVADECFVTGTGAEVVPVTRIDRQTIGTGSPGPITRRMIDAYRRRVRES
jgi:branched-chain amino acid aminotransferase